MMEEIMAWFAPVGQYTVSKLLPMIALAALGILVVQIVSKLLKRLLEKTQMEKAAHTLILTSCRVALYILLALAVASGLGIDVTGVVALASVLTLAVSLSIQNILTNVFGGFTLLYTKPFGSDDYVEIAGQSGTVREIGLCYTMLVTPDNKIVSIPNSAVAAAEIVNYSDTGTRRLDINLAVSYGVNPETVLQIMEQASRQSEVLETPAPVIAMKEYNEQSITYVIMLWCNSADYWNLKFAINRELSRLAKEAGIRFYDPQMKVFMEK